MLRIAHALILLCLLTTPAFAQTVSPDDAEGLLVAVYRAIADGAWFPVAGAATLLILLGARKLLLPRYPTLGSTWWGVAILAALAGAGALGHAWLAEAPIDATTLVGALKVFATAIVAYFVGGKLRASKQTAGGALVLLVAIGGAALATQPACPGPGPAPVIADVVIDCLGDNRAQIDALLLELSPLLALSSPDWSAVYQRAKQAGRDVGGCALAELVQRYLGGRTAVPDSESWRARDALERFRNVEAGNATFRTAYGDL